MKFIKNNNKKRERGFSLFELAMYLGIAAVLVAGITTIYQVTNTTSKFNKLVTEVTSLQVGVRNLFATQRSYAGVSSNVIASAGVIPKTMITTVAGTSGGSASKTITHAFDGLVGIKPSPAVTSPAAPVGASFLLRFKSLSQNICNQLAVIDFGDSQLRIGVGPDAAAIPAGGWIATQNAAGGVVSGHVAKKCTDTSTNSVSFDFK